MESEHCHCDEYRQHTVQDLIDRLMKVPDKDKEVRINLEFIDTVHEDDFGTVHILGKRGRSRPGKL